MQSIKDTYNNVNIENVEICNLVEVDIFCKGMNDNFSCLWEEHGDWGTAFRHYFPELYFNVKKFKDNSIACWEKDDWSAWRFDEVNKRNL